MGKITKLHKITEAKEIVTLVLDRNKYQFIGNDGVSKEMSAKEVINFLTTGSFTSPDTKTDEIADVMKAVSKNRDSQVDLSMDAKQIKKLNLK